MVIVFTNKNLIKSNHLSPIDYCIESPEHLQKKKER